MLEPLTLIDMGPQVLSHRTGVRHGKIATLQTSELGPWKGTELSTVAAAEGRRWEGLEPSSAGTYLKIGFLSWVRSLC